MPKVKEPAALVPGATGADTASDTLNLLTGLKLLEGGTVSAWEFDAAIAGTVAMGVWEVVGQDFKLKCVDTLVVTKPGLQSLPGSCSFDVGDVFGIGCKGPGVVNMLGGTGGTAGGTSGAGIVQFTGIPALAKVGEDTSKAPSPADRSCCVARQYALRVRACAGWGWTFVISLSAGAALYLGGGVRPRARSSTRANENCTSGWPKLWANFRALIGIFSQRVGPSPAIWANPVQCSLPSFLGSGQHADHQRSPPP
jgi:hypothetical protein